jgi:hypothetical protein
VRCVEVKSLFNDGVETYGNLEGQFFGVDMILVVNEVTARERCR